MQPKVRLGQPSNPTSGRYSTYWDRKGWPGSEIQMYYGCPCDCNWVNSKKCRNLLTYRDIDIDKDIYWDLDRDINRDIDRDRDRDRDRYR